MIENLVRPILGKSDPKITHGYFRYVTPVRMRTNNDPPVARLQAFTGIERVHDQVEEDLLNLDQSAVHLRKLRIELGRNDTVPADDVRADKADRFFDNGVEVQPRLHAGLLADKTPNPLDHLPRAAAVRDQRLQQFLEQRRIDVSALDETSGS